MMRRPSEESTDTLVRDDDAVSMYSEETLAVASTPVFNLRLSTYTRIRELPVVEGSLSGLALHRLRSGGPLFTLHLNKLHFLRKNAPLLHTYVHRQGVRSEFCTIYFKVLHNNLTCYVLMFASGTNLVLFNYTLKALTDFTYKGSKIRVEGTLGAFFGNSSIRLHLLSAASPTLADGLSEEAVRAKTIKDIPLASAASPLCDAVTNQQRGEVLRLLAQAEPLSAVPFASYVDHDIVDGAKTSSVRMFESVEGLSEEELSEDLLVIATVMLVLVFEKVLKTRSS